MHKSEEQNKDTEMKLWKVVNVRARLYVLWVNILMRCFVVNAYTSSQSRSHMIYIHTERTNELMGIELNKVE